MAIRPERDYFAAREKEEAAVRLAHRSRRAERRLVERRRVRFLTVSVVALGLVLMAGGLTALGSTRGAADVGQATPLVTQPGPASSQQAVAQEAMIARAAVSDTPSPPVQKRPGRRPASEARKQAGSRSASGAKTQSVRKPPRPVSKPATKTVAKLRPTRVLVRKCSAECHATAALLTLRFDRASAAIVADGMVEAQGVRLTRRERAAVIAALSRK
jgi:hypothetical protein